MATYYCIEKLHNLSTEKDSCLSDYTHPIKGQLLSMQVPIEQQYGVMEGDKVFNFFCAFSPNSSISLFLWLLKSDFNEILCLIYEYQMSEYLDININIILNYFCILIICLSFIIILIYTNYSRYYIVIMSLLLLLIHLFIYCRFSVKVM